ncbi:MFS transporter [Actinacidiphila rubida]|uniref:Predicted arabinose efflux permease, MFS family n=1 Tax=Actinacidiphila rubida TaxID=310780 RepID=A0A1H8PYH1_9ACTN|nr:MFS transporter [Actinacidiphila rubida]SEO46788.1 Predicted arabinose efflux permease, MFS family [Actinacidiphila rubida]
MGDMTAAKNTAPPDARAGRAWSVHLLSLAAGSAIAVGVIYLPQTLLSTMAADFGVTSAAASILPTVIQVGYALGIFFLVPLADRVAPRRQVTVQSLLLTVALLATAVMPGVLGAALGFAVVGLVANIAQVIIAASPKLAPPGAGAGAVATIVGSLTVGIFGGRIMAGLLVTAVGWRWVVVLFAVLVLAVLLALRAALHPAQATSPGTAYRSLLGSTLNSVRTSRATRESVLMQFFVFAAFNALWAAMVLHLTGSRHAWSAAHAGLFGLVGMAAGLASPVAFRFTRRMSELAIAGTFLLVFLAATTSITLDADVIPLFAVSVFLATGANQFIQTAAQRRVLTSHADHPAPANALFMVGVFAGGATGSFSGVAAFTAGGMRLVGALGAMLIVCGSVVWALAARHDRKHQRRDVPHDPIQVPERT